MSVNKVAIFIQDFNGGGAERMMINLANGIVDAGKEVDLLVVRNEGPFSELVCNEINMSVYLKKNKPDVLYSTLKHVNIASIIAKKLTGVHTKIIIREACHLVSSGSNRILQKIAFRLVPYFYPKANEIVAVSEGVAKSISSYCNLPLKEISILPNPSITDDVYEKAKELPDHDYFSEDHAEVILGVGRLSDQKNFESLISAFSIVREKLNKNLKLIILGEGPNRAKLEQRVKKLNLSNHVSLPGFKKNPYSYMSHSSLFVLSSRYEGSPNVLVEAMACGTSVVATDCPSGPKEILEDGKFGKLTPIDNDRSLADAIYDSLQQSDKIYLKEQVKSRANDYDVHTSVKEYLNLAQI